MISQLNNIKFVPTQVSNDVLRPKTSSFVSRYNFETRFYHSSGNYIYQRSPVFEAGIVNHVDNVFFIFSTDLACNFPTNRQTLKRYFLLINFMAVLVLASNCFFNSR
jgi:hypothetical protein